MPSKAPRSSEDTASHLQALGHRIRAHRKALRVSAIAAAQAAGMSRVTWHRIESGQPAVTMGAYLNAITALGLKLGLSPPGPTVAPVASSAPPAGLMSTVPEQIRLADYPHIKQLAWHVHGIESLTPQEVWGIVERNQRHVDETALTARERALIAALRERFDGTVSDV